MTHAMPHVPTSIILTRPTQAAQGFAKKLRQKLRFGGDIILSPLLRIEPVKIPIDLSGVRGLVFTSGNAVSAFAALSDARDLPCWCVGTSTRQQAQKLGLRAIDADGDAEALIRRILADAPAGPLLHIRGQTALGDVAQRLTVAGVKTRETIVYQQVAQSLSPQAKLLLQRENPVILPLFSPNTARQLASQGPFNAPLAIAAISENTAREVANLQPQSLLVAEKPDGNCMLNAVNTLIATD